MTDEMRELRERARKAIDNLKGMSGSMARVEYENGKGIAKLIEDLLQALSTVERENEHAIEVAEANILASIQDGGKSCHWCREKVERDTRERCAEIAEKTHLTIFHINGQRVMQERIANAIRREKG